MDRYWYSGVAYSVGANSLPLQWAMGPDSGLPVPHCVIYLSVRGNENELVKRGHCGKERYEKVEVHRAVAEAYESLARLVTVPWLRVDGVGAEEEVFARVLRALEGKVSEVNGN